MADSEITNPNNAYQHVTDYRTMKDASGAEVSFFTKDEELVQADGAIAAGLAVAIAAPTSATVPPRVTKATATTGLRNVGIVKKGSAAAGDVVTVVTEGLAFATLGGTVTANAVLAPDSAGKLVAVATTALATVAAGTAAGTDTTAEQLANYNTAVGAINANFALLGNLLDKAFCIALAGGNADDTIPVLVLE